MVTVASPPKFERFTVFLKSSITVVSPLSSDKRRRPVPIPMGRRYLNVTHCSKQKDAVLKSPIAF